MTDLPADTLARLRAVCLALPDAYEETAWVGTRWRVRQRTFAHALVIRDRRPEAYATAAGTDGPAGVLTFRVGDEEFAALGHMGHPYFVANWGREIGGVVLDDFDDWDEIADLLSESYCLVAPDKLVRQVDRPPP